jgi:hypothetical protein
MTEVVLIAIMGLIGALLTHTIVFVLGQRSERKKQSLLVRSQMLNPIEDWLAGAEKLIGILSDTLVSVQSGSPLPMSYDFEERRKANQYMSENTNRVIGIIESKQLRTRGTKRLADQLAEVIRAIDSLVKYRLLPQESEILDRAQSGSLPESFLSQVMTTKLTFDNRVQEAHSLLSKIRAALA